ncbi:MAG: DUF1127 domain-containing protein [Pseudomonadota bacterium]
MHTATHATIFDRIAESLRDFATAFMNARYAAMDLERLHAMSDFELAYRGLERENIADYVRRRYMK